MNASLLRSPDREAKPRGISRWPSPPAAKPRALRYLLDLEGTQRFIGTGPALGVGQLLRASLARAGAQHPEEQRELAVGAGPIRPIRLVTTRGELETLAADLLRETVVALDVETTLFDRELCTLQVGTGDYNAIVDVLAVRDLEPLVPFLESTTILKLIHNATFERSVLARINLPLTNILDTLTASRRLRGKRIDGGHGLAAVCARELGRTLDKSEQKSDWTRRPLSARQVAYAALDVEVLVDLYNGCFAAAALL